MLKKLNKKRKILRKKLKEKPKNKFGAAIFDAVN